MELTLRIDNFGHENLEEHSRNDLVCDIAYLFLYGREQFANQLVTQGDGIIEKKTIS